MNAINIWWLIIIIFYSMIIIFLRISKKTKVEIGCVALLLIIMNYCNWGEKVMVWFGMFILPVPVLIIWGSRRVRNERRLFKVMESKLRYAENLVRTEYRNSYNKLQRCIITYSEKMAKNELIVILPQPTNDLYIFDYNGNCMNQLGQYEEGGWIYNYAPYNELADALAEDGYFVIRMDMLGSEGKQIKICNIQDAVVDWVDYIKNKYNIESNPIVIGHGKSVQLAESLIKTGIWKCGIFLCRELSSNSTKINREISKGIVKTNLKVLQVDAGNEREHMRRNKAIGDIGCNCKFVNISDMDNSLRRIEKKRRRNISQKGYGILCGTEKFPPIHEMLRKEIVEYLKQIKE